MKCCRDCVYIEEKAVKTLAHLCDGDARVALNSLQSVVESARAQSGHMISMEDVKEGLQRSHVQYDRAGQRNHWHLNSLLRRPFKTAQPLVCADRPKPPSKITVYGPFVLPRSDPSFTLTSQPKLLT